MNTDPQPDDALTAALGVIWERNRDRLMARARIVLAALEDMAAGRAADLDEAARQAHAMAGALGTYGRPGSEVFAEAEQVLEGSWRGAAEYAGDLAQQVHVLLTEL